MQFVDLDGFRVSRLAIGTSHFARRVGNRGPLDTKRALRLLETAYDAGINFIDTADVYGSEELVGRFAHARRDKMFLATKFGFQLEGTITCARIVEACERSLQSLETSHIDLFQVHSRFPELPEAELLEAGERLREAGKIRSLGCSNYTPEQIAESNFLAMAAHVHPHVSVQVRYSMVEQSPLPTALQKPKVLAFRVFGGGLLAGRRPAPGAVKMISERMWEIASNLSELSRHLGIPAATLALSWVLQCGAVDIALLGLDSESQLLDALRTLEEDVTLELLQQIIDSGSPDSMGAREST